VAGAIFNKNERTQTRRSPRKGWRLHLRMYICINGAQGDILFTREAALFIIRTHIIYASVYRHEGERMRSTFGGAAEIAGERESRVLFVDISAG
jgi:hypothetical protein